MAQFELYDSFDIDDGELDHLSKQGAFVLGYELCQIDTLAARRRVFEKPVHVDNQQRIRKTLDKAKADYSLTYMHEDNSEMWMRLHVKSYL